MNHICNEIQLSDNTSPALSVIVPIYGVEEYLDECIESIINQSFHNMEIILVDDGSKGKESKICDKYASIDQRIKVIHKKNEGLIAARKSGLSIATAPYVTFVDGDDWISPDYYHKMMYWIETESPDIVAAAFTRFNKMSSTPEKQEIDSGIYENNKMEYLYKNMHCKRTNYYKNGILASVWSKIFRTDLLRDTSTDIPNFIKMGEDAAFTYPYLLKCRKIVVDNSIKDYNYRMVEASMSKTSDIGLFIGSSALYEYLKPFYLETRNDMIIEQLEFYRAFLIDVALSLWMNAKIQNIHHAFIQVKKYVLETSLFHDMAPLLKLSLPDDLKKNIFLLENKKWHEFKFNWYKFKIKAIIKSRMPS